MGVAFRELPGGAPGGDYLSRAIVDCGEHPLRTLRSWVSPPADGARSPERSHTARRGTTAFHETTRLMGPHGSQPHVTGSEVRPRNTHPYHSSARRESVRRSGSRE